MLDNKRGAIGDTLTWIVATIIIIVILIFGIFIAGGSDLAKEIFGLNKNVKYSPSSDTIAQKSLHAYLLTPYQEKPEQEQEEEEKEKEIIYDTIKREMKINSYNGPFARQIFNSFLYGEKTEYWNVWFGVNGKSNTYFEWVQLYQADVGDVSPYLSEHILEQIKFAGNNTADLYLRKK